MKQLLLFVFMYLAVVSGNAQSANSSVTYKKIRRPSLMLELEHTQAETEGTILAKLKESGYNPAGQGSLFWKKNTQDGFYVFKNVRLKAFGSEALDLYFRVEPKKRGTVTNLHLLVSNGNENFIGPDNHLELWHDARAFLDGFKENAITYRVEQNIKEKETKIKSLLNRQNALLTDQKDLEARIARYQLELENNLKRQAETSAEIENHTRMLDSIKVQQKL